ncbi:uncharacterized protein LOC121379573 [Gigantopelta aegis]|uniref:uncharacterized protein LOC121379573 n=1 Tax=Gigantopelta aegis TaxID=1735272 RepID=UPI001B887AF4|nr:uncharacterized protein LOC121379573 [Gigantopelta aegis]
MLPLRSILLNYVLYIQLCSQDFKGTRLSAVVSFMDNNCVVGENKRTVPESKMSVCERIKLEGIDVIPARVEGMADVYQSPRFVLCKPRWIADEEVTVCVLCSNKFNQLRRKHHCRQCGRVLCSKCCHEKIPMPQLGVEESERVCESCRPITELVTKSRSKIDSFLLEAASGLCKRCQDPLFIKRVVELGGIQTLVALGSVDDANILRPVLDGLHTLSTHQPLHHVLAESGAIKTVCSILGKVTESQEQLLIDGISSLRIFCKSADLKTKALSDGALRPILKLCTYQSEAIALLALSTLSLIVEHPDTHDAIVDNALKALPRILALTMSSDEQTQEVALKTLAYLSCGSTWHRHRIVQEDFSSGDCLQNALQRQSRNPQIMCNTACLVANLATNTDDQTSLQPLMSCLCETLKSGVTHADLLCHISRGIANFAKFKQNANILKVYIPVIVKSCVKSSVPVVRANGMRAILSLLTFEPSETTTELMRDGAGDFLQGMGKIPGLIGSVQSSLLEHAPARVKPM